MITSDALNAALPHILAAPKTDAPIDHLCTRPAPGQRAYAQQLHMTPQAGIAGERWLSAPWLRLPNGDADPAIQVSILPLRVLDLVWKNRETVPHPGDPIIADLDCSLANLPTGTLIRAGSAVLRVSSVFNDGCVKWKAWYGAAAKDWITSGSHPDLRLRGILCAVHQAGIVAKTDKLIVIR